MTAIEVRQVTIVNRRGLHARAAARLVQVAGEYDAEITLAKDGAKVSGLSIMGLMMLAASPGSTLERRAGAAGGRCDRGVGRRWFR